MRFGAPGVWVGRVPVLVGVNVKDGVMVGEGVGVEEALRVRLGVRVGVLVFEGLSVLEGVGVNVGKSVDVSDGTACRSGLSTVAACTALPFAAPNKAPARIAITIMRGRIFLPWDMTEWFASRQ